MPERLEDHRRYFGLDALRGGWFDRNAPWIFYLSQASYWVFLHGRRLNLAWPWRAPFV